MRDLLPSSGRAAVRRLMRIAPFAFVVLVGVGTFAAQAQTSERRPELPAVPFNYASPVLPAHFAAADVVAADNTPANNPVTDAGATLGRVLFYDVALSANDSTSCASCHIQANSFSDPATLSQGFEGGLTGRHSMSLANAAFYERGRFFWDERAATLEDQVLMPIQDSVEMGLTLDAMETKLAALDYYPDLFEAAFGSPEITSDRVSLALAQFVRSMISSNSRFDQGVGTNFANFTQQENQGRRLFNQLRCASCHETTLQIGDQPRNIGLDATTVDEGANNGRFKVPSLRNIEVTAPYMHDGRFATLEQVVDFYDSGVQAHPALANQLDDSNVPGVVVPQQLNLTQGEKDALIAFMRTLTDQTFLTDERFGDPFVTVEVAPDGTCDGKPVTIDMADLGITVVTGTSGDDVILGTSGDDTIVGAGGNDTLCGLDGNDVLWGGAGDDVVLAGSGNDVVLAGSGEDRIEGGDGADQVWGNEDADTISGGNGDDVLQGGDGVDVIDGGADSDAIHGQAGADQLSGGTGADFIWGYDGNDTISGGDGDDVLQGMDGADEITGGSGVNTLIGGPGDDTLTGGAGIDVIWGLDGDDDMIGAGGNDVLLGNDGNDTGDGGPGIDWVLGHAGADVLTGGDGVDLVWGGGGDDQVSGGAGDDIAVVGELGNDTLFGNEGNDTLLGDNVGQTGNDTLDGGDGDDVLWGFGGDDALTGGAGNDTLLGGDGDDSCDGGTGTDGTDGLCEQEVGIP